MAKRPKDKLINQSTNKLKDYDLQQRGTGNVPSS
jgi:hypothetical protein